MIPLVRIVAPATRIWILVCACAWLGVATVAAQPAHRGARLRVAVQPFAGDAGPVLRDQIARLLRARGFQVVTTLPRVGGTGQYLSLARDHQVAAFVTGDVDERRSRHSVTFLLWDGATGSVQGRWSAAAAPRRLPRAVAKGFWKHLGPAFEAVPPLPSTDELPPAEPLLINAGEPLD
jgi:hypothetical protein